MESPRPLGAVLKKTAERFSVERRGSRNPALKSIVFNYTEEEIAAYAKVLWVELPAKTTHFRRDLQNELEKRFPRFLFMFADILHESSKRGWNKTNTILSRLCGVSLHTFSKSLLKRRGIQISKGQLASEEFIAMASEHASRMVSTFRITKPHLKLYAKVLSYDKMATMEYKFKIGKRYRSFDIFSPKINAMIEMNGRVWHDPEKAPASLLKMAKSNALNDIVKRDAVVAAGFGHLVFWDDEQDLWDMELERVFEE